MAKRRATGAATTRRARKSPIDSPQTGEIPTAAGEKFQRLVDIMARLRAPDGCPWDREQTLESLRAFVLEETHEVLDAIDRGDTDALRGEVGDLIFEGVFLAEVCAGAGQFPGADSLRAIATKLIRRHPHISDPSGRPLDT